MSRPKKSKDTKLIALRIEKSDLEFILSLSKGKSISNAVRYVIKSIRDLQNKKD